MQLSVSHQVVGAILIAGVAAVAVPTMPVSSIPDNISVMAAFLRIRFAGTRFGIAQ
ncbi:hypothetical protein [Nocardia sp. NPDC020380]|uniref:hypothetical protein n=1 Tax=Nocardia sp. NPDC020380 TaxID=3364309 RepID=UPI0037BBDCFF